MELNKYQQEVFDKQRPVIETFGKKTWGWTIFFLLWILVGWYALYLQIAKGHSVTGMRDNVVYFLYWNQLCRCSYFRHTPYSES
jgi:hypothetical protein